MKKELLVAYFTVAILFLVDSAFLNHFFLFADKLSAIGEVGITVECRAIHKFKSSFLYLKNK